MFRKLFVISLSFAWGCSAYAQSTELSPVAISANQNQPLNLQPAATSSVSAAGTLKPAQTLLHPAVIAHPVTALEKKRVNIAALKKHRPVLVGIEAGVKTSGVAASSVNLNSTLTHANIVRVSGDGTETVLVSMRFPNRIATPFDHPRIIDASTISMQVDGSNIFVSPKTSEPFAIYVTGDAAGDPVVSLTLIPKDIPAQTIALQLDTPAAPVSKRAAKLESYSQHLVDILRQVAMGKVPEGYSEARMPNMIAKQEGLNIVPEMRYSGSTLDIYRYKVENNQSLDIELSETQFYQNGVKAVAIYPSTILGKGETTNIYVVGDKSMLDGVNNNGN